MQQVTLAVESLSATGLAPLITNASILTNATIFAPTDAVGRLPRAALLRRLLVHSQRPAALLSE